MKQRSDRHPLAALSAPVLLVALFIALPLSACSGGGKDESRKPPAAPQVGFVVVQQKNVPLVVELTARVAAYQMAEVRPQVSGIIKRRFFTEGALVREGQTLYEIDPRLYRAATNEARANLQSAQANAEALRVKADRFRPLAEAEAVSKQDYTDVAAQARQAAAAVAQGRAQLDTAQINLRFTAVPAPITGRIGRSLFTQGALVTSNQTDPLAVIQRLDPIFVDIQQSSADLLTLRRSLANGGAAPASASVRLILEDGSEYPQAGTVQFSEVMVNVSTGTVTLRASFANPDGLLLPGMFVRARFAQAIDTRAILVPQAALSRTARGLATVFVVGPGNKAVQRTVTADRTEGAYWVVTKGLKPGEKVIVQGLANVKPDAPIRPVAADSPQKFAPPSSGSGAANGAAAKGS